MASSASRWGRALLWMISIVLLFLLSALAAFFAGSLMNGEPPPTSDRGPTTVEETTHAPGTENKPEPKTVEKTTPAANPEPKPPDKICLDTNRSFRPSCSSGVGVLEADPKGAGRGRLTMHLASDYIHPYKDAGERPSHCRVRIYLPDDLRDAHVIVCSELPNDPGALSPTRQR